jgi:hypothetical protein
MKKVGSNQGLSQKIDVSGTILTGRTREEIAHLSSNRKVGTDVRPRIKSREHVALKLHPELVERREAHYVGDE